MKRQPIGLVVALAVGLVVVTVAETVHWIVAAIIWMFLLAALVGFPFILSKKNNN